MIKYSNHYNFKDSNNAIVIGINESYQNNDLTPILNKLNESKPVYQFGEITVFYPVEKFEIKKFVFVGVGNKEKYSLADCETIFSKIAKEVNCNTLIDLDSFSILERDENILCEKLVETIELVKYEFENYKTDKKIVSQYDISIYSKVDVSDAIISGVIYGESTNHARDLVNEPRNKMTPQILADYAENLAKKYNIDYKIYQKSEIEKLGMGAFLAVNQGSKEEAKLIHIKYRNVSSKNLTALIGKGLTYDSGGYSIKPKDGMPNMKTDMGGAAAVLGAIEVIARKKMPVNIDVIIPTTENMINSEAMVPDDVITAMNGKTIEVTNTDAEGRLTLVDAVTFAKENKANKIIDVATLTGGVVTALGIDITGVFTNNYELLNKVKEASKITNEDIWELPVDQFREKCKKTQMADYNNSPGREGHASFGAALIAEFAEETPWVHLDIAGTISKKTSYLLGPEGATGVMVRTVAKIFDINKNDL